MKYQDLLLEKKDEIAILTLNVPEKLNCVTTAMKESLPLAVDEIAKDDEVRVVILTGAGRGFCSGADVSGMATRMGPEGQASMPRHTRMEVLGDVTARLFPCLDKPVIAAVNGVCAGMGFSLALSCDIRIASETARFSSAFILRGLVPDNAITYWLPRMVGTSKAMELMLTGDMIDVHEAERLGIVSRIVPPDDLMKVAQELAARIAKSPPIPVEMTKRIVYRTMQDDISRHLDMESWGQVIARQTEDHREAVRAFLEKRPQPKFKGR